MILWSFTNLLTYTLNVFAKLLKLFKLCFYLQHLKLQIVAARVESLENISVSENLPFTVSATWTLVGNLPRASLISELNANKDEKSYL